MTTEIDTKHELMKMLPTSALISWARRAIQRAEFVTSNSPEGGEALTYAHKNLDEAQKSLGTLIAHAGPPVAVGADIDDLGTESVTFSRESKAHRVIFDAARAVVFAERKGGRFEDRVDEVRAEMYADLMGSDS